MDLTQSVTKRRLVKLDPLNRQVPPSDFVHFLLDGFVALGDGFHAVVEASVNGRAIVGKASGYSAMTA